MKKGTRIIRKITKDNILTYEGGIELEKDEIIWSGIPRNSMVIAQADCNDVAFDNDVWLD
jgi:hypothetical protein